MGGRGIYYEGEGEREGGYGRVTWDKSENRNEAEM